MKKKCVPEGQQKGKGQARGQGEGPMGTPKKEGKIMNKVKEATKLVDTVFDNPSEFKIINRVNEANKLVDNILENCGKDHSVEEVENQLQNAPDENPEEEADKLRNDIGGEDEAVEGATEMIDMYIQREAMNAYQKFVQSKLKAAGVKSPAQMDPAKRKAFFSNLSKEWKAKKGA